MNEEGILKRLLVQIFDSTDFEKMIKAKSLSDSAEQLYRIAKEMEAEADQLYKELGVA